MEYQKRLKTAIHEGLSELLYEQAFSHCEQNTVHPS